MIFSTRVTVASNKKPLRVALCGMDSRTAKTMTMFLHGPCKDAAVVVSSPDDADINIFEGDLPTSKKILEKYFQENPLKPMIVISLWDITVAGVLHVKKPVNTENMLKALQEALKLIDSFNKKRLKQESLTSQPNEKKEETTDLDPNKEPTVDKEVLALLNYNLLERRQEPTFVPLAKPEPAELKLGSGDWFDEWFEQEQTHDED
jgi:hypothetical protein